MPRTYVTPPPYRFVPNTVPDRNGSFNGCGDCDFRPLASGVRCSDIPCQRYTGMVARIDVLPNPNTLIAATAII